MKFQPVIKWSGSKRSQSEDIVKRFPKEIDTYYEPFVGGASVLFQLLHSDVRVKNYICSDINEDLINLWNIIKDDPDTLCSKYEEMWNELNNKPNVDLKREYYNNMRDEYNKTRDPQLFLFLSRTCVNGLIRYNSKNEFNTSFHFSRKGIEPNRLKSIVMQWSNILNEKGVKFVHQSYDVIEPQENDFMYLDPPYINTKGMYFGNIDYVALWEFLRNVKSGYIMSFDGITGDTDNTYNVPEDIYTSHEYLYSGISGFNKIHNQSKYVKESLYIKYNTNTNKLL